MPANVTVPEVAGSAPVIRLKLVLLPAPFGPISAVMVPAFTSKDTLSTATRPAEALGQALDLQRAPTDVRAAASSASAARRCAGGGAACSGLRQILADQRHDAAARLVQQQDEQAAEHHDFEIGAVGRQMRQQILQPVLGERDRSRTHHRAGDRARAAEHRHQQIFDAGLADRTAPD